MGKSKSATVSVTAPAVTVHGDIKVEGKVNAPAPRELSSYATKWPDLPFLVGPSSQEVVLRIQRAAQVQDKRNPEAYDAARLRVAPMPTRNVHPSVAQYKAAVLDYLEGRALALRSA